MEPAVSYRIVKDGPCWQWEVRFYGLPLASGTEDSAVRARVQALLRGASLARERSGLSDR
jgi:hypothetical protein